ncbi:glycosyltransferase family 39 protein [Candidatus Saccharibacteria bacterium]|nr:glycosyltransferase family 39 protein [Candidatus Saccharibacteria bacterium]
MFGRLRKIPKLGFKYGLAIFSIAAFIFFAYFWRLGTLTSGQSASEAAAAAASSSLSTIVNDPTYGPHKIAQFVSQKIFGHGAADIRIVSVLSALFFLVCFYKLVRGWFGKMISLLSTTFLAATPWFILIARNGSPAILLLAPLAILASYYWFGRSESSRAFYVLIVTCALSLYVPGMIWLILLGLLLARKDFGVHSANLSRVSKFGAYLLSALIIAPLIYASVNNLEIIKSIFLVPEQWAAALISLKSIVWSFLALVWRTPTHAEHIIGRLPMLNIAQIALATFGCFALYKLARPKMYLLVFIAAFGIITAGINRNLVFLTFALAAVAVALAAGLRYLYMEWKSVFPLNPIPKYMAIVLLSSLVLLHVSYGLRYSLVAWPNTTETRATFMLK